MSLIKQVALANGFNADYIRLDAFRWDRVSREMSAVFQVYKDSATANTGVPASTSTIKLRVLGPAFTQFFGTKALSDANQDIVGMIYAAAKQVSSMTPAAARNAGLHLITDFGHETLKDSVDG